VFISFLLCAADRSYVLSGLLESGGLLLLLWLNASPAAGPVQLLGDVELGGGACRDLQHVAVAHRHLQTGEKRGFTRIRGLQRNIVYLC
jgi:hypothetical protein